MRNQLSLDFDHVRVAEFSKQLQHGTEQQCHGMSLTQLWSERRGCVPLRLSVRFPRTLCHAKWAESLGGTHNL